MICQLRIGSANGISKGYKGSLGVRQEAPMEPEF